MSSLAVTATTPGGAATATFTTTAIGPLPIPSSLPAGTTWVAPAGVFTMPAARTACHGNVIIDLSAATLVDGGGTVGLASYAADCTSLLIKGAGVPVGTNPSLIPGHPERMQGCGEPAVKTYTTTPASGAFVNIAAGASGTLTFDGFSSDGLTKLSTGQNAAGPSMLVIANNTFCKGLAVGLEGYHSIEGRNTTLRGGGPNTNPVGCHIYQYQGANPPATRALWVPGLHLQLIDCEISGFVSNAPSGFLQGDNNLLESDCQWGLIENCYTAGASDSGVADSKADWLEVRYCYVVSIGGRAVSGHVMGSGTGPFRGVWSHDNVYVIVNGSLPSGGFTECYQAEGIIVANNDTVTLASGARLAVTAFQDAPGSGAPGSYPRLGSITLHGVHDPGGTMILGPTVKGDDATHHTTIVVGP